MAYQKLCGYYGVGAVSAPPAAPVPATPTTTDPALPAPNTLKTVLVLLAIPLAFIVTGKE